MPCFDAGSAVTTFETVLAWLGSTGAGVRLCGDRVEGVNRVGDRIVVIDLLADNTSPLRAHTRHVDAARFAVWADWTVVDGEPGVRYLARWLVDGGSVKSPYVVARKEL